jgi:uncharacterized protein (DUF362 family)
MIIEPEFTSFLDIIYLPVSDNNSRSIEELYSYYYDDQLIHRFIDLFKAHQFDQVVKGKTVLVKPNLVLHPKNSDQEKCLITHPNFILQAVESILEFNPSKVIIGDAPIQLCKWDFLFNEYFFNSLSRLENKFQTEIVLIDFRRTVYSSLEKVKNEIRPMTDYILFDLKTDSLLEPITDNENKFRVTNYNPDRLALSHSPGKHLYCIAKELFEAEVIIQLPKIKTHQKTGITNALKNLVGINGDKDFLPHHRIGGSARGGDCYPGSNSIRYISENFLDNANRNIGSKTYYPWYYLSKILWKLVPKSRYHSLTASWYGNDTTWRMVADLNIIAMFGNANGELSQKPVRKIYSLCDGIIGGQGDGPLKPKPLPMGVIMFTNHSVAADTAVAKLMRFDISLIPLIRELSNQWPIKGCSIQLNNETVSIEDLKKISIETAPPPGWSNYIEESIH